MRELLLTRVSARSGRGEMIVYNAKLRRFALQLRPAPRCNAAFAAMQRRPQELCNAARGWHFKIASAIVS